MKKVFFEVIEPNVSLNEELTEKDLEAKLNDISYTKGIITQGSPIINKGEVIDSNKLLILESLKKEYQSDSSNVANQYIVVTGYSLLVGLALLDRKSTRLNSSHVAS